MKWAIAAPFIDVENQNASNWLEKFVPGDSHQFTIVPRSKPMPKWHDRKSKFTTVDEWLVYWKHASTALHSDVDGVITVFPQLASAIGMQQAFRRKRKPVIAWLFNVGTCSLGYRRKLASLSMRGVDLFVVHTRREIDIYSEWLGLPKERFEFAPYQVPLIGPREEIDNGQEPFVAALGTAHRDFGTFLQAVGKLNFKTLVVAGKGALDTFDVPGFVETPTGLSKDECIKLAQRSSINVVPLMPKEGVTAAGQITIAEGMMMGCPMVVTDLYGADDYIIHGETGWLVKPNSVEDMAEAIDTLWRDDALRRRIGENARAYALEHFSDDAAGLNLKRVLDVVGARRR